MKAEKKKVQILTVAEDVFARKGFSGATVREIAEGVNIKTAALYYHFKSKEDIFNSLIADRYIQMREHVLDPVKKEPDARQKLHVLVEQLVNFWAEHPRFPRILAQQVLWGPGDIMESQVMPNFLIPMFDDVIEMLGSDGLELDGFRDVDVPLLVFNIFGMTIFYFFAGQVLTLLTGEESFSPDKLNRFKEEIIGMVFDGVDKR